jgi:Cu-Zn family superoxide dismutase
MKRLFVVAAMAAAMLVSGGNAAHAADTAVAILKNPRGKTVGRVTLRETPNGVLLHVKLFGLARGTKAFHVHAVGKCVPPFKSAGGHYNPGGVKHGILVKEGPHAGDMPNVHVPANGRLEIEILNTRLRLSSRLFDSDGASIVMHAKGDDYRSQPSGAAGGRIACGVIRRSK